MVLAPAFLCGPERSSARGRRTPIPRLAASFTYPEHSSLVVFLLTSLMEC